MDFPNVFPESFPMVCVASFPRHGGEIEGGCGLGRWEGKIPGSIGWELRLGFWFGDVGGYFCWCSMDFHHGNLIVLRCSMDFHQFSRFPGFLFQDFLGEIWKSTCVCVCLCVWFKFKTHGTRPSNKNCMEGADRNCKTPQLWLARLLLQVPCTRLHD